MCGSEFASVRSVEEGGGGWIERTEHHGKRRWHPYLHRMYEVEYGGFETNRDLFSWSMEKKKKEKEIFLSSIIPLLMKSFQ